MLRKIGRLNIALILGTCVLTCGVVGAEPTQPPDVVFLAKSSGACMAAAPSGRVIAGPGLRGATAKAIENAPYSGVGTTEVVRMLPDGNRIVRTNTMRYYRDSQGRTRTEHELSAVGPFTLEGTRSIIMIDDPVARRYYVLHPELKRADEFELGTSFMGPVRDARAGSRGSVGGRVAQSAPSSNEGPAVTVDVPTYSDSGPRLSVAVPSPVGADPTGATAGTPRNNDGNAGRSPAADERVLTARAGAVMELGPGCGPDGIDAKAMPPAVSLGERTLEGLKVIGSRHEFVIATGEIGNEQPITVRSEQWFSPELGVVLESKHRDPLMGDTTYRLTQVRRGQPDASLFSVPADYTTEVIAAPPRPAAKLQTAPEAR